MRWTALDKEQPTCQCLILWVAKQMHFALEIKLKEGALHFEFRPMKLPVVLAQTPTWKLSNLKLCNVDTLHPISPSSDGPVRSLVIPTQGSVQLVFRAYLRSTKFP